MKVAYWPGCVSRGFTPELHGAMAQVAPALDIELVELNRANCCGAGVIAEHSQELADKARDRPAGSGTVAQLDAGVHAIGKKIVEEAAEVWMAAEYESDDATAEEVSQLLYHVQVLMLAKGLSLEDVYRHL